MWFNFLGRDFFNALSEKNEAVFWHQLVTYLSGFAVGIPVFITKDFLQSKMSIDWRQWMTRQLLEEYLDKVQRHAPARTDCLMSAVACPQLALSGPRRSVTIGSIWTASSTTPTSA